jgi:HprK-related kinase A
LQVSELSLSHWSERLSTDGAVIPCGPFHVRVTSGIASVAGGLHALYADFPVREDDCFVDFEVTLHSPSRLRRWVRPQASLSCDGRTPFKPLPLAQAFPMLEWGLNWVISSHAHQHLVLHAAVVEKGGHALILAADPGSGKSTLCAALVQHGWRLLSDELALLRLDDGLVTPIARPISLKNGSIDVVRALSPSVELSRVCHDTAKGSIAHMRPPRGSVTRLGVPAQPALIVFPHYRAGARLACEAVGQAHAFLELVRHAFNFPLLGGDGFDAIAALLEEVQVFRLQYSTFEQALPEIDRLWSRHMEALPCQQMPIC